jgi:hypothetical protein
LILAARPDLEPLQEIDGRAQQGGGAVVGIGRATSDQGGPGAGLRQRDRRRNSGRPAADYGQFEGSFGVAHPVTIDVISGIFKPARQASFVAVCAAERRNRRCAKVGDS